MRHLWKFKCFEKEIERWLLCVLEMVLWKCFGNFPLGKGVNRAFKINVRVAKDEALSGKPLDAFLKWIPGLFKKPGISAHRSVFLASVCILSQYSWVFSIEVREMLPVLPDVFRVSFSETTLCLALLSLLSMPLKCIPPRQDRIARQASGFRTWLYSLGPSYQLLPVTARSSPSNCMCPFLLCKD